jgi:hypothetical protein
MLIASSTMKGKMNKFERVMSVILLAACIYALYATLTADLTDSRMINRPVILPPPQEQVTPDTNIHLQDYFSKPDQ